MVGVKAIGFKPLLSNLSKVKKKSEQFKKLLAMVEVTGFEPATPSSRTMCATKLRYTSIKRASIYIEAVMAEE